MKIIPYIIGPEEAGQRIDNFLFKRMKGLPKSRLYRAFRTGEVRVNHSRVKPNQKLNVGDQVRIPPLRLSTSVKPNVPHHWLEELEERILFEDDEILVIDKPSGIPVHGGTGLKGGVIDALREKFPEKKFLELIHRLDKETSGCLLIAKKRSSLLHWQQLLVDRQAIKQYLTLVRGHWELGDYCVEAPLRKNILQSGERMVKVNEDGKPAFTEFHPLIYFENATLMEVRPLTGRTHQIRVHAAYVGHPIAGDSKYGDRQFNQELHQMGLHRLFLHAGSIGSKIDRKDKNSKLALNHTNHFLAIGVQLADDLQSFLKKLKKN